MSSSAPKLIPQLTKYDEEARIMRIPEVLLMTGFRSRRWLYTLISRGEFPQPVKLRKGGRASGWPAAVVHDYLKGLKVDPLASTIKSKII